MPLTTRTTNAGYDPQYTVVANRPQRGCASKSSTPDPDTSIRAHSSPADSAPQAPVEQCGGRGWEVPKTRLTRAGLRRNSSLVGDDLDVIEDLHVVGERLARRLEVHKGRVRDEVGDAARVDVRVPVRGGGGE
eukprot:1129095-Pleurochrysis_carterae.AAC.1